MTTPAPRPVQAPGSEDYATHGAQESGIANYRGTTTGTQRPHRRAIPMPMGQHNAGPMHCLQLNYPQRGHTSRQVDDPREPANVDLGSNDNLELFPDPLDVLSRPRIRERTTRLAPRPIRSPTRAEPEKLSDTGISVPPTPHTKELGQDQMQLQHHLSVAANTASCRLRLPPPPHMPEDQPEGQTRKHVSRTG